VTVHSTGFAHYMQHTNYEYKQAGGHYGMLLQCTMMMGINIR